MDAAFHVGNRQRLYEKMPDGTITLVFAGKALRKTGDEYYSFFASRNFVYLTGLDREGFILMAVTDKGQTEEKIFIQSKNPLVERWTGVRLSKEEVEERSGIADIDYVENFQWQLHSLMRSGKFTTVAMDLFKQEPDDQDPASFKMAEQIRRDYPYAKLFDIMPIMRELRTIKQPCEIEGMRKSMLITKAGIEAMMAGSRPGMTERQYKALYDYALTWNGCLSPGFPSIISAGENNFIIHYYDYTGTAKDGDMILNDVSACYDNVMNDVSRGWPCNGKFSERQKLLYTCAYNTSEYLFSIIRPGMPMESVDQIAREYNFKQLQAIGLLDDFKDIRKYMWHGGAHHVGYDVHDQVCAEGPIRPGMVFCVDIGIYVEEWGIGFRLEDNCLVTEDGCENLTRSIPRSIEEIEAFMAQTDHSPINE